MGSGGFWEGFFGVGGEGVPGGVGLGGVFGGEVEGVRGADGFYSAGGGDGEGQGCVVVFVGWAVAIGVG